MKTILFIVQKEFKQIFRNKAMLPMLFIMPVIQLLVLSNAASFEIKNIKIAFVDNHNSVASRELISKFDAVSLFINTGIYQSSKIADEQMELGKTDVILEIPQNWETQFNRNEKVAMALKINAIDGAAAGIQNVYVSQIVQQFYQNIQTKVTLANTNTNKPINVLTIPSFWYNTTLNYKTYMVPGILVLLITMLTLFLSGMNIVREKELGTLEQINVTPIKKHQFIIGKLFPFWVIGFILLSVGLIIAKVVFNVPMLGNIVLIYLFTGIYLLVILGIGLFISNFTDTQQQAMFIAWFFMVIFILMSGLFTPIDSMPIWAQKITLFNPIRYFVEVIRMVLLKGATLVDVKQQLLIISLYAFVINGLAIISYKKVN